MDALFGYCGTRPFKARSGVSTDFANLSAKTYFVAKSSGSIAAVTGEPTWSNPRLAACAENNQAEALTLAVNEYDEGFTKYIEGGYGLAYCAKDKLILVSDPFASHNIYYVQHEHGIFFSTQLTPLLEMLDSRPSLSHQAIFDYLFFHMIPSPGTIYQGIYKLEPGQILLYQAGTLRLNTHYNPEFSEKYTNKTELQQALHSKLAKAVASAKGSETSATFLSGGLDSSTITGLLSQVQPSTASFSVGFEIEKYNEIKWARIASKRFGTKSHELFLQPQDAIQAIPKIARFLDEPFGNSSVIPTYLCAKYAKESGYDLILAGDGGDELFAGNERYAKQHIFELYKKLPGWLRQGILEPALSKNTFDSFAVIRKARSYISQAKVPLPDRLQSYNFIHRLGIQQIFTPDFLTKIDPLKPAQMNQDYFQSPQSASQLNRMLFLDWKLTLADNDLRKVTGMCQLAGIKVKYPMLDPEVVKLSCKIPSRWKMPYGKLRAFYKQSFANFLPKEIISKPKHGFGLPFGIWALEDPDIQDLVDQGLSYLEELNIFNPGFLDHTKALHTQKHAAYYGELIWLLMMLGLWLESHDIGALGLSREDAA